MGAFYEARKFKAAVDAALRLSQEVNRYVNDKAPWQQIKTDPAAAATARLRLLAGHRLAQAAFCAGAAPQRAGYP